MLLKLLLCERKRRAYQPIQVYSDTPEKPDRATKPWRTILAWPGGTRRKPLRVEAGSSGEYAQSAPDSLVVAYLGR